MSKIIFEVYCSYTDNILNKKIDKVRQSSSVHIFHLLRAEEMWLTCYVNTQFKEQRGRQSCS